MAVQVVNRSDWSQPHPLNTRAPRLLQPQGYYLLYIHTCTPSAPRLLLIYTHAHIQVTTNNSMLIIRVCELANCPPCVCVCVRVCVCARWLERCTCLLALRTVLRVAICSLLVLSRDLSFSTSSRRASASRSKSLPQAAAGAGSVPLWRHRSTAT